MLTPGRAPELCELSANDVIVGSAGSAVPSANQRECRRKRLAVVPMPNRPASNATAGDSTWSGIVFPENPTGRRVSFVNPTPNRLASLES